MVLKIFDCNFLINVIELVRMGIGDEETGGRVGGGGRGTQDFDEKFSQKR